MKNKPKLWKYKSGEKKGKLRPASKKYLSYKLKDYHKRQRIIKAQFKEEKFFKKLRTRKQICYNSEYSLSIRAIQINGEATLKELEHALTIFLNQNPKLYEVNWETKGLEEEEIDSDEDKGLKDGLIYIEFNNRGSQNLIII